MRSTAELAFEKKIPATVALLSTSADLSTDELSTRPAIKHSKILPMAFQSCV
ncbi:MAG TPA: hypothetical protein VGD65_06715 [Chryseosolibacter sp.]